MGHDPLTRDLLRLADGDRSAFDPVYDAVWPRVRALSLRLVSNPEDAEDVAQRALLRVFERSSAFDPTVGRALPWVLGVAAWECRSHRRWRQRRREEPLEAGTDPVSHDLEDDLVDADLEAALRDLIGTLRPVDRETLSAAMGDGPRPSIAPATFRKRLQRALDRLRAAWRQEHG